MVFIPGKVDNYFSKRNRLIRERKILAKERVERMRSTPTIAEKKLFELLTQIGIEFEFQKAFITEWVFAIPDFFIESMRLIIEVDGSVHNLVRVKKKDALHNKYFKSKGYDVLRMTNEHVMTLTKTKLKNILKRRVIN